jgi:hypothetical protein
MNLGGRVTVSTEVQGEGNREQGTRNRISMFVETVKSG